MSKVKVIFDKNSRAFILSALDAKVDSSGFIINKLTKERVLTPDGNEIKSDELAIIEKGSTKFIPGDLTSLMKFSKGEI